MPTKKKIDEKATVPVKLNYTPSEFELIEQACAIQHARRQGPWIRDVSLDVARKIVAADGPGKKGSR